MKIAAPIVVMGFLLAGLGWPIRGEETANRAEPRIVELIGEAWIGAEQVAQTERRVSVGSGVKENEWLRTGKDTLVELEFADSTSIRVASFSKFHYSAKDANFVLEQGEGVLSFPKGKGGYTVSTPSFAASIQGTTIYLKITRNVVEYACLEGRCRIGPHTLTAGEKLVLRGSGPAYSTAKQPLNLNKVLKENKLASSFSKPLPNLSLIQKEAANQK
jgi:hypothetical protein